VVHYRKAFPAFGDSIGGMNIAGGISAALFHRERTGEAVELDVSLLSTAWWAGGASVTQAWRPARRCGR
jgi:crotonobetainyl-CoA:carnitine CoA-transferase CaiB-like acyl-CoA transferase